MYEKLKEGRGNQEEEQEYTGEDFRENWGNVGKCQN